MTSIDNTGFLAACGNCDCPGFIPALTYSYNAGTKALTITDASTFPAGNGIAKITVSATDGKGNTKTGQISTAAGNVVLDLSTGLVIGAKGFNIRGQVVTALRCAGDLSAYNVPNVTATGGLTATGGA